MATLAALASKLVNLSATMASSTLGAVLIESFRAKIHKEIGRFRSFPMGKKQLLDKLLFIRGFLEFANTQNISDEQTLDWLCEIEKRVSDAEAALREIGEDDPNWLNYCRRHAIWIEEHSEKLDVIANFGSRFCLRSEIRYPLVVHEPIIAYDKEKFSRVLQRINSKGDGSDVGGCEIARVFEKLDGDGDGKISSLELIAVLRSIGFETSVEQLNDVLETDGDGFIDLKKFSELLQHGMNMENEDQDLRKAFEVFNDGNEGIPFLKLGDILRVLGSEKSVEELKRMMLKKLGKKRSVDDPSSSNSEINPGGSGTTDRKLKKMRTELKA